MFKYFQIARVFLAATERVSGIMNNFWTSDKTQLKVDTLKGMLISKINFDLSCTDFNKKIKNEREVLKIITEIYGQIIKLI